jgi:Trk K+ transport system NAD-binding subunit
MTISSYLIKYESLLFGYFGNNLKKIDVLFKSKKNEEESKNLKGYNIIFFGYYDLGKEFFSKLEGRGKKILVIENDPQNIRLLKNEKIPFVYGSIYNPYFLDRIDFNNVEIAVSSLVNAEDNKLIIKTIKRNNPKTIIIATAKSVSNSLELYDTGADYVIYPSYLNEQNVSVLLEDYTLDINRIISKKIEDVEKLKEKEERIKSANKVFDINDFLKKL